MSLRIRFFAWDADEGPPGFALLNESQLGAAQIAAEAGAGAAADVPHLVCVGVISADDEFEGALFETCATLEMTTGQDFTTPGRHALAYDELASFSAILRNVNVATEARPWFDAASEAVTEAMAGYAHLAWDVFWDQAGVVDGPDEQPLAADAWTGPETTEAIEEFLDVADDAPPAEQL